VNRRQSLHKEVRKPGKVFCNMLISLTLPLPKPAPDMYHAVKKKTFTLLHPELGDTRWDKVINTFIIVLIILNVFVVMLETVPSIYEPNKTFFKYFDIISVAIFTVEYILRVWSSNHDSKFRHSIKGRLRYMLTPEMLIDLLAFLPFYLQPVLGLDLRAVRILRLMRFLRLFRLTAYMKAAKLVANVFRSRINELILSLILVIFLIIIASSILYFVEHKAQPDVYASIPHTVWWAIVTLTTTGYGDMVPVTAAGKIMSGIIMLTGVALFALPAGIITAGFLEEHRKLRKPRLKNCPHCGKPIHDDDENHGH
jgi:voltage-gated potassium channel